MNKVRIFCDIDDTLWDLLKYWIELNNKMYVIYPTDYDKLSTDYSTYKSWKFDNVFSSDITRNNFFDLLSKDELWDSINVDNRTKDTLLKINFHPNIELYIVTSMKWDHASKINRFLYLFPFIEEGQIITCHDKWVLDGDICIDDKPETLEKCSQKGKVIKINKPYNSHVYSDLSINDFSDLFVNDRFANLLESIMKCKEVE